MMMSKLVNRSRTDQELIRRIQSLIKVLEKEKEAVR